MDTNTDWDNFKQQRAAKVAGTPEEYIGSITVTISKNNESSTNNLIVYPHTTTGVEPITLAKEDAYTLHFSCPHPLTTQLSIIARGSELVVIDYNSAVECTYSSKLVSHPAEEVELIFVMDVKTRGGLLFVAVPVRRR